MVSLLISRVGKEIGRCTSPEDAYARLLHRGYLSDKAVRERTTVVEALRQAAVEYEARFRLIGDEPWRHAQAMLLEREYLSWWGRHWGLTFVSRH
jgi:hypothetical protein